MGLLAAATIFNVLGMVGLSLIIIYSGAYNKCKTIQTKKNKCLGIYLSEGVVMTERARKISV